MDGCKRESVKWLWRRERYATSDTGKLRSDSLRISDYYIIRDFGMFDSTAQEFHAFVYTRRHVQEDLRREDHAAAKDRIYFLLQETNFLCDRN